MQPEMSGHAASGAKTIALLAGLRLLKEIQTYKEREDERTETGSHAYADTLDGLC
jgi:hypothetical protein